MFRKKPVFLAVIIILIIALTVLAAFLLLPGRQEQNWRSGNNLSSEAGRNHVLPAPLEDGTMSLEQAMALRRSIRSYRDEPLPLSAVSQLLWSAQGITDDTRGFRTVPSAGALYPLEVYLIAGDVHDLDAGIYHYSPEEHSLQLVVAGDLREELSAAALNQQWVLDAPVSILLTAFYQRTARQYGNRATQYVHLEAGHAGQNISLQAVALGLATVPIGAFRDNELTALIGLSSEETPLYLFPVGYPE